MHACICRMLPQKGCKMEMPQKMAPKFKLVGGFNPFEKYARKIGSSSPNRGEMGENSKNI